MSELLVSVGQSNNENSFQAGREGASVALEKHGGTPEVLIMLGACRFDHKELLAGVVSAVGDIPMVGGTTAGEISMPGFSTQSVAVMALSSDELDFFTGIGLNMRQDERACSTALAEDIRRKAAQKEPMSLVVFPDGMGGDGVKVIEGFQEL